MHPPLFVLAPPRSHGTLVSAMLGQHPDLYDLPEINLFGAETYSALLRTYRRRRQRHGLLRAISELALEGQTEANVATAMEWLADQQEVSTAGLFGDLMAWAAPRRLVDHSPTNVYDIENLDRIRRHFPEAQYLHLTCHPRTTCEALATSSERRSGATGPGGAAGRPERTWFNHHSRIVQFLADLPDGQRHRIRSEELLEHPVAGLKRLLSFVGANDDADALDAMLHPEHSPFARQGPRNALGGNGARFLADPMLQADEGDSPELGGPLPWHPGEEFSDELKALAREFGYA